VTNAIAAESGVFIHESAYVDEPATIGSGTKIWHFSHVMKNVRIGENCSFGQNVFIASNVRIGRNVKVQNNVSIYEGVVLEDDVFCGPSMVFTNVLTPRSGHPRNQSSDYSTTQVRRGASIGANATIVCGHTVGAHAFIGAGAVVTSDIPDYAIALGCPARIVGYACECGLRLHFESGRAQCPGCQREYEQSGELVSGI